MEASGVNYIGLVLDIIGAILLGALKNQVQHPDRVWCCDGKTLRTIEA
jgi:hypothetical protein